MGGRQQPTWFVPTLRTASTGCRLSGRQGRPAAPDTSAAWIFDVNAGRIDDSIVGRGMKEIGSTYGARPAGGTLNALERAPELLIRLGDQLLEAGLPHHFEHRLRLDDLDHRLSLVALEHRDVAGEQKADAKLRAQRAVRKLRTARAQDHVAPEVRADLPLQRLLDV